MTDRPARRSEPASGALADGDDGLVVLGIDPGTARMGYGVVRDSAQQELVDFGCWTTSADELPEQRLLHLYRSVLSVLDQAQPDVVAVERLFFNRNVTTAMSVSQARGVVLLAAAMRDVPVAEYTPLEVKQAVSGFGRAGKDQMQRMIQALFQLPAPPHPDDAADAVAVAVCHLHYAPARRLGLRQ